MVLVVSSEMDWTLTFTAGVRFYLLRVARTNLQVERMMHKKTKVQFLFRGCSRPKARQL